MFNNRDYNAWENDFYSKLRTVRTKRFNHNTIGLNSYSDYQAKLKEAIDLKNQHILLNKDKQQKYNKIVDNDLKIKQVSDTNSLTKPIDSKKDKEKDREKVKW